MSNFTSVVWYECIQAYIQFVFYSGDYILYIGLIIVTSVECTRLLNVGLLLVDHANEKHEAKLLKTSKKMNVAPRNVEFSIKRRAEYKYVQLVSETFGIL